MKVDYSPRNPSWHGEEIFAVWEVPSRVGVIYSDGSCSCGEWKSHGACSHVENFRPESIAIRYEIDKLEEAVKKAVGCGYMQTAVELQSEIRGLLKAIAIIERCGDRSS